MRRHPRWHEYRYARRHPRPPWPFAIAVLQVILFFALNRGWPGGDGWAGLALVLAGPAALVALLRRPGWAVAAVCAIALAYLGLGLPLGAVAPSLVVAVVSAVVRDARPAAWLSLLGLVLGWYALGLLDVRQLGTPLQELRGPALAALLAGIAEVADNRRQRVIAFGKLMQEEKLRREEEEQRRASEERLRVARELHDVLAHSLSLITVRASVALEIMDTHPDEVREALRTIKQASRDGLDEVRSVLAGLRSPNEAPRRPAPGLGRLDELVADARTAGLDTALTSSGAVEGVPAGVGLAAYRIIQEALTNVVRHSQARTASVHLHAAADRLVLGVTDPGPARPVEAAPTSGNGLIGIRERAAALGGTATAETDPAGGFTVLAMLPYPATGGAR